MKKFIIKLLLFLSMLCACDYLIGYAMKYLYSRTVSGDVGTINSILRQRNEILIMGSSRAKYHYDPAVLSDAFNRRVYNAGIEGQGILCQYGLMNLIVDKYHPKAILLNIDPADLMNGSDAYDKLNVLLPHSENNAVRGIVSKRSKYEKVKLLSKIYPYNSLIISLIACQFLPQYGTTPDGYEPVNGTLTEEAVRWIHSNRTKANTVDLSQHISKGTEILDSICDFAQKKSIKLIVGISPSWVQDIKGGKDTSSKISDQNKAYAILADYFSKKGIPVIQITQDVDSEFINYSLFNDTYHLNKKGASLFSKKVALNLKPLLNPASLDSTAHISDLTRTSDMP